MTRDEIALRILTSDLIERLITEKQQSDLRAHHVMDTPLLASERLRISFELADEFISQSEMRIKTEGNKTFQFILKIEADTLDDAILKNNLKGKVIMWQEIDKKSNLGSQLYSQILPSHLT